MKKISFTIIILSLVIFAIGLLLPTQDSILVKKIHQQLFLTGTLDSLATAQEDKGYVIFTIDSTICGVCVTNIHDYVVLLKQNYPQYEILYLFNENTSSKNIQRFYSMIDLQQKYGAFKFDSELNAIKFRNILFTNLDLQARGRRSITSSAVPNLKQKKYILQKGVSLITN